MDTNPPASPALSTVEAGARSREALARAALPGLKGLSAAALARVVRWWIVGLVSLGGDLGAIYLAHERLGLPLPVAALVAAEAIQLLRFLANDRWVFGHRRPTWTRLWQYHVACASGAALHWVVLNSLAWLGLYYLLATVAATGVTVSWSMLTNFGWVWRRHGK